MRAARRTAVCVRASRSSVACVACMRACDACECACDVCVHVTKAAAFDARDLAPPRHLSEGSCITRLSLSPPGSAGGTHGKSPSSRLAPSGPGPTTYDLLTKSVAQCDGVSGGGIGREIVGESPWTCLLPCAACVADHRLRERTNAMPIPPYRTDMHAASQGQRVMVVVRVMTLPGPHDERRQACGWVCGRGRLSLCAHLSSAQVGAVL